MERDRLSGKLAVILHADIAGSTALVQQDKQLAHERIQDSFRRLGNTIEKYQGRVLELRGDALLAEFARASDAVSAALSFQVDHAYYIDRLKDGLRPTMRVGIAMGEVIIADNTVTGAGVVQAQRVEQLADPGDVCITAAIQEALSERMPIDHENLGEQVLKGFDYSVQIYRVELRPGESILPAEKSSQRDAPTKSWGLLVAVVAIALVVAGSTAYWYQSRVPQEEPASVENMAYPLPDKPSIAVLPFTNMSGDAEQEYFVDGMTEDLITDLSQISGLFVIARNSVFTYKDKPIKIRQVAEELGVRYVLEGSVRRAGNQVRINAQLIDATTGGHIWAKRYDGSLEDVFALQDEVTQKIVAALAVSLTSEEEVQQANRSTDSTEAHDAFLQGWAHYILGTRADLAKAKPFFEEAIRLDPDYALAHAGLATVFWDAYSNDWTMELGILSFDAEDGWIEHLELAMKIPNALAHTLQSRVLVSQSRYQEAVVEAEKAVALDGDKATAYAGLANALILAGKPAEGADLIRKSMRLDPHHPPGHLITLGQAQFEMEQFKEAAATFERAVKRNVDDDLPWIYLASSYGHLGRIKDADDAIGSANDLRAKRAESFLNIESKTENHFQGEIDFSRSGGKQAQERLRAGLTEIPALRWQNLATHLNAGPVKHWFEVKGATAIDVHTAKSLYDRGVIFVDARPEKNRNKEGWIPRSVSLPESRSNNPNNRRLTEKTLMNILDKTDEVVFYGEVFSGGEDAAFASAKSVNWGYENVFYFSGWWNLKESGFHGWKEAGYPVETGK
jgi:TolB-like protein/class 3 adenylate cyclase